jgi:hypothetical protein
MSKKLAAVVTVYRKYSHAQHIVDRFLDGYGWNGAYHQPPFELTGLYVDQIGADDLSKERASRHPSLTLYPTIKDALTLGTGKLAVDGVMLVGEHGNYPKTEKGQVQYPRYQFFRQIVDVYRDSGRSVPLFNDKHLSWNWAWADEMYKTARSMNFAFMAGSSLPVTWRIPVFEMPLGATVREAVCVCYGGVDSYDFHGLESIQCLVERRKGGETGVKWLQAFRGESFWKAMTEGVWQRELVQAALCRSHTLTSPRAGFNDMLPTLDQMKQLVKDPVAYTYEHDDGLRCTLLLLDGLVRDFNFAARLDNPSRIVSTQLYLPMPDGRTTLANFFSPLAWNMEQLYNTGRSPYPIERTLLTTGLTACGVDSLHAGGARQETPHLAIRYQPPTASTFERT